MALKTMKATCDFRGKSEQVFLQFFKSLEGEYILAILNSKFKTIESYIITGQGFIKNIRPLGDNGRALKVLKSIEQSTFKTVSFEFGYKLDGESRTSPANRVFKFDLVEDAKKFLELMTKCNAKVVQRVQMNKSL